MRWLLAAAAFAVVIGLALATTAIRVSNVHAKARIELLERRILANSVERAGRDLATREAADPARLASIWRDMLEASRDRYGIQ